MTQKIDNTKLNQLQIKVVPTNQMPDYHNDPLVIAMVEKARAFLKKAGLSKGWNQKIS